MSRCVTFVNADIGGARASLRIARSGIVALGAGAGDLVVDLRGDSPIRMGVPSDVARASRQSLARKWSQAFHEHPSAPDGIIYASRLNGETNIAVYDRAIPKLRISSVRRLIDAAELPDVLDDLWVAIV